jgi:diguanylate cyclase (GGDEF)-like protein
MFRRSRPEPLVDQETARVASVEALDTLGSLLRTMGEFALDQEKTDAATFTALAERWAQHVLVAGPAPTGGSSAEARRDWAGVRNFVTEYCQGASTHTRTVMGDLRQVVWVFIQNLSHAFAEDRESDARIREQLIRLEQVAGSAATGDLKREVLATVNSLSLTIDERRKRHREHVEVLGQQVLSLGTQLESARRESETDPLTKLYNRKALDEYLARSVELHAAFGHATSLLLVDIDRFKGINDGHGHQTGDEVLRKVADAVTRVFLRKNDFVARYGGDELAVVLRETSIDATATLAERLVKKVRTIEIERNEVRVPVTTSIGIAALLTGQDVASWLDAADKALYRAKQRGRDQAVTSQMLPVIG